MIKVVDSIMGSGKTTSIFKHMNSNKDKSYLYISIFLDEVGDGNTNTKGRIQKELPEMDFKMPRNIGDGKLSALKNLINKGYNISSTHALFHIFDKEVVDLLIEKGYVLIIDEAVDCIKRYKEVNKDDILLLKDKNLLSVDEGTGRVVWNEKDYPNFSGKYKDVRDLSLLGNLFIHNKYMLIWEYPPQLLRLLPEVYILTYLFEGSLMVGWLKINDIPWSKVNNTLFGLQEEAPIKKIIRDNIQILNSRNANQMRRAGFTFSASSYKDAKKTDLKKIRGIFESCVKMQGAKIGDVFWTTYKGGDIVVKGKRREFYIKETVSGNGYTKDKDEDTPSFLAFNTKATNKYREYSLCLYGVNPNKDPKETAYIKNKGAAFNYDKYSLSEAIQFLFRGCIREGKPMKVLILSERIEKLVRNWLDE